MYYSKKKFLIVFIIMIICFVSISIYKNNVSGENNDYIASSNLLKDSFILNLISKSDGLDEPDKESGKTEYEICDINHDGFLDIISVGDHGSPNINSNQHGIMVWLGNGGINWSVIQTGNFGYGGCGIGDLNLDGINDIAWGVHHDYASGDFGDALIEAALGDGSGGNWIPWDDGLATNGEEWGMFATDLADFDIDGDLDIISESFGCCNGIQVYENLLNGSWQHVWDYSGGNVQYTLETGDFNSDGYFDFICSHYDVCTFFGEGDFVFTNIDDNLPIGSINAVDVGDMNNDGRDDILLALTDDLGVRCYIFDIQNDNWISKSTGLPQNGDYSMCQFGDINGDGFLDIVFYDAPQGVIYLGNGNGNWVEDASWTMPSPGSFSAMRIDGDVDFDGREDIIIQAKEYDSPFDRNVLRLYSAWNEPLNLNLKIKSPNGGETLHAGSICFIKWLSTVPLSEGQAYVDIELSQNGANGPWIPIVTNYENSGRYQWITSNVDSENCRIKITINSDSDSNYMISTNDFTIIGNENIFVADANGPYNGIINETIYLNATAFGGIPPYQWSWDFGDGNFSNDQNTTHSYTHIGTYQIILNVTDSTNQYYEDYTYAYIENYSGDIDISQELLNKGLPVRHATDGDWAAAQNFTPTVDTLTKVEIYMRTLGWPDFDFVIELREEDPTGSILAAETIPKEEISDDWMWLEFDFEDILVDPDIKYCITVPSAPIGITNSFGYEWAYAFGDLYPDGAFWFNRLYPDDFWWMALPNKYEFSFRTYGY